MEDKEITIEKLLNELMEMSCSIVELKASVKKYQIEADALRADEKKYQTIMENIPQKIFTKDKNLVYGFCNENYARDLKIKPEEISGKTDYDFFPPEIAEKQVSAEKRVLATGKEEAFAERYFHDGQEKLIHKKKIPLKDEKGNIIGILGIEEEESKEYQVRLKALLVQSNTELQTIKEQLHHEITKRQQAEEAWQKKENFAQRLAQENALLAEMGRILMGNLSLEEMCERFGAEIGKLIPFDRMTIAVPNLRENTLTLVYAAGTEIASRRAGGVSPLSNTGEEEVIKNRSPLLLQKDHPEDVLGRFEIFIPYFRVGFQSLLLIPLLEKDQVIGILTFLATKQNAYTKEGIQLAARAGSLLTQALAKDQLRREGQRLEETWRESESRLQSLLEFNPDAVFSLDLAGKTLNVNPACSQVSGYSLEELQQKSFLSLVGTEGVATEEEHFQKAIQGQPQNYDIVLALKDGGRREIRMTLLPITVRGRIVEVYGIARKPIGKPQKIFPDFELMIDHAPIGLWIYLDGTLRYANPKCTEILGYSREELTSKPLTEFLHSDDRKMVMERYASWLMGKTPPNIYASRFIHKEGYVKWLKSKVALISWEGKPAIINYLTDITERMWSQETMHSLMEQHRALLKCIEDIFYTWDRE